MPHESSSEAGSPIARRVAGVHGDAFRLGIQRDRVISLSSSGSVIGWRFETALFDAQGPVRPDSLDWRDAEQIDFAVVDAALEERPSLESQPLLLLPAAFSTLSSRQGRRNLGDRFHAAARLLERRPALEIYGIAGVPPARVSEVASLIRPACAGVIAQVAADRAELAGLGHCGLAGFFIRPQSPQSPWSDEPALLVRLQGLTELARGIAPICIARGREADRALLSAAGFSHAALSG